MDGEQMALFEGHEVEASTVKVAGSTVTETGIDHLEVDEEVWLLVRGRVSGVNHERKGKAGVLTREHKVAIVGARRVDKDAEIADAIVEEAYDYLSSIPDQHPEKGDGEPEAEGE